MPEHLWMDENEQAVHDSQEELKILRNRYERIKTAMRVMMNSINRCECGANKGAIDYLRSKQHTWKG
jgi:hypothetical protein